MSGLHFDTSDLDALNGRLAGADRVIQKHMLRGVDKSGKLVEGSGKANVNVVTGHLRRNITSVARSIGSGAQAIIRAATPYAEIVEKGRGAVVARRAKALRFTIGGRVVYTKRVGPAPGQWYMKRALESNRGRIITILRQEGIAAANEILGGAA